MTMFYVTFMHHIQAKLDQLVTRTRIKLMDIIVITDMYYFGLAFIVNVMISGLGRYIVLYLSLIRLTRYLVILFILLIRFH